MPATWGYSNGGAISCWGYPGWVLVLTATFSDSVGISDALTRTMYWGKFEGLEDLVEVLSDPKAESFSW